jgi:sugar/nucleoside kinase (ribokinase family)
MMKKYDVITSGYVSMDRIIKVLAPLKVGFTSLVQNSDNAKVYYGGCSVNIAYELAKLGMKTLPYIRVGDDYKEIGFYDFLKDGGVCLDAVKTVHGETTSNCYLLEDVDTNHVTVFYPGAMDGKYAGTMRDEFFEQSEIGVLTVGSYCDNLEFYTKCKKHNLPLVFGMKADFDAFPRAFLKELLNYSKIIFANNSERETIEHIFGMTSITELFHTGKAEIIVITMGSHGSMCYQKVGNSFTASEIRIARCDNVVDTTGSGDAYMAGFLYGYLKDFKPNECCNLGSLLSSFIIEKMGCCTNAPDETSFLKRYEEFLAQERKELN